MTTRLPVKQPIETPVVTFDFSSETASVTSPTFTFGVHWSEGTPDPSPSAIQNGAPTISGAKVYLRTQGGLHLNDYAIVCRAVAADGTVLANDAILPVRTLP